MKYLQTMGEIASRLISPDRKSYPEAGCNRDANRRRQQAENSVAGKCHGVPVVMAGIMGSLDLAEADKADHEEAEQPGKGKLHQARAG
jgi:hypothetical protein